jgi:hypothetical protein
MLFRHLIDRQWNVCVLKLGALTAVPPPRVPKILAHKIQLLDSEALKYRDRPGQMSLLRKHLKDNEWLLASGLADRIVNQQRTLRMQREKAVEARARKNAALLKR